ncbi:RGS domain-containing protein (Rax1) [Pochonia chlamydosporia 170]|uniref:RGS domain-containing protein (Rax1) n=1 Tax=Pochonia chlamydosporia 170 TaxID=1380566 RepID=A0A179F205_METCM|nr:RGS domain-containing protein (Rax1) [Pochonia chlamydosporia 170]OAQ59485.1 RGS domain-containing protein (Rax1) [Pochonia chlamydosporia 170]
MDKLRRDDVTADFFGPNDEVASAPPGRVAIAKDNARLFVGNVINNHAEPSRHDTFAIDSERSSLMTTSGLDPITLTAKVFEAATPVASALRSCQKQAARFKIAALSIALLHTECAAIRTTLIQIKSLLSRDGQKPLTIEAERIILEDYYGVLEFSWLLFNVILKHLRNLGLTQLEGVSKDDFTAKMEKLWEYREMDGIIQVLGRQARAVDLFHMALQSETEQEISTIMKSPEAKQVIASISGDTISLHESFCAAPDGASGMETASVTGGRERNFNQILKCTALYQRASMAARQDLLFQHHRLSYNVSTGEAAPSHTESTSDPRMRPTVPISVYKDKTEADSPVEPSRWKMAFDQTTPANESLDHYKVAKRPPTLFEILSRRTTKPYSLIEFYVYMRDVQLSVDYLDFWLDVEQHLALCRHYVREFRRSVAVSKADSIDSYERITVQSADDNGKTHAGSDVASEPNSTVARQDIRASAEKILYTFLLPGAEREIILPSSITQAVTTTIEEDGRDDPEVFDAAKDYVFHAMERDAFPGFVNLSKPLFRIFRRSGTLGSLVNRLSAVSPEPQAVQSLHDEGLRPLRGNIQPIQGQIPTNTTSTIRRKRRGKVNNAYVVKGHGCNGVVRLLLEKGISVDAKDEWLGRTPLSWAAGNGHVAVVKQLLEKGAIVDTKDKTGQTPLWLAAGNGHEAVVRMLIGNGAAVDAKDEWFGGRTPLSWAARNGHEVVVRMLIEKGAAVDVEDENGWAALRWAATIEHETVARLLIEKSAVGLGNHSSEVNILSRRQ